MSSTKDEAQVGPEDEKSEPEGKEESKELSEETDGVLEEDENERIQKTEYEHEKAKRRKRGNNTQ